MESVVLVVAFGVVLAARLYFSNAQRIKRRLRAARAWPLAELPENTLGRVIGRVRALDEPLRAPLTGRACVYFIATVQYGGIDSLRTIVTERKGVPFVIEDESGRAIVDPADARITLVFDHWSPASATPATPEETALLARHGYQIGGAMDPRSFHFSEAVIAIGEKVAVLGSGIREPDRDRPAESAYRAPLPTLLRLTSSARYPLLISDEPKTTIVEGAG